MNHCYRCLPILFSAVLRAGENANNHWIERFGFPSFAWTIPANKRPVAGSRDVQHFTVMYYSFIIFFKANTYIAYLTRYCLDTLV